MRLIVDVSKGQRWPVRGLTLAVLLSDACAAAVLARVRRVHQHAVVGVRLYMFLEVLWPLERLAAEVALMRLERDVDADVGGDVIAFDGRGAACSPLAGQVEVIGALATDMALAHMVLKYGQRCAAGHGTTVSFSVLT